MSKTPEAGGYPFESDPFEYQPEDTEAGYLNWLHNKIQAMTRIIVRQQGESEEEQQKTVRLRRWLYNGLYAVGVRQDAAGTHEPFSNILILLDPKHPNHEEVWQRVAPFLSEDVRADFDKLRAAKDPRKQQELIESAFNRLLRFLGPIDNE